MKCHDFFLSPIGMAIMVDFCGSQTCYRSRAKCCDWLDAFDHSRNIHVHHQPNDNNRSHFACNQFLGSQFLLWWPTAAFSISIRASNIHDLATQRFPSIQLTQRLLARFFVRIKSEGVKNVVVIRPSEMLPDVRQPRVFGIVNARTPARIRFTLEKCQCQVGSSATTVQIALFIGIGRVQNTHSNRSRYACRL